MRMMVRSDFLSLRHSLVRQALLTMAVGAFVAFGIGSWIVGITVCAVALPFSMMMSLLAADETNGWQSFRLTLPLSRRTVVVGRYASIALLGLLGLVCGFGAFLITCMVALAMDMAGQDGAGAFQMPAGFPAAELFIVAALSLAAALVGLAIMLPFVVKMGFTRAIRYVPVIFMVVIMMGWSALEESDLTLVSSALEWLVSVPGAFAVFAGASIVYALSCMLSVRLYRTREF